MYQYDPLQHCRGSEKNSKRIYITYVQGKTIYSYTHYIAPPAVDYDGSLASRMFLDDSPVECQDGRGIVWHSVVRPGSEVEVCYSQRVFHAPSQLEGG